MERDTCVAVAVQDETIRRTVVFVIKVYGHPVVLLESLTLELGRPQCIVLDLPAMSAANAREQLSIIKCPCVMLTDTLQHVPSWYSGGIVLMPLLGDTFLEAVNRAIASDQRAI